ncbi:MAG: ABC transporter substrate-binding protein [Deltaproteobacteria bacterium]|nr:ABC transporter substrate-binding protein [Deltaproteobacteria bacterium]
MAYRIVSLLPSATEIVCALGARAELVGVSHECDHPDDVSGLPVLTRAKFRKGSSSAAIDQAVRDVVGEALAVYDVDTERLGALAPDVIVTQDLCDVCAVSIHDVRAAVARLAHRDAIEVVSLSPTGLEDILADIERTGVALGRAADGTRVVADARQRIEEVRRRAHAAATRPSVLSIEWLEPVMIGGMWMPELITLAGGTPLVTQPRDHAPTLPLAELEKLDPDVVLIKPCGFPLDESLRELEVLSRVLPWSRWKAVANDNVFLADGNAYFNRSGPRLVESLEILAACLHPDEFTDHHERYAHAVRRVRADLAVEPWA